MELYDAVNDLYAEVYASVQAGWTRLRIPLKALNEELEVLGEEAGDPENNQLLFSFIVEESKWTRAARTGKLVLDLGLDEIILEREM